MDIGVGEAVSFFRRSEGSRAWVASQGKASLLVLTLPSQRTLSTSGRLGELGLLYLKFL